MTHKRLIPRLARPLASLALAFFLAPLGVGSGANTRPRGGNGQAATGDTTADATADTTAADSTNGTTPDTLEADMSEARRSGRRFSPIYTSGYDVKRNIDTWSQGLTFSSWVGPLDITSSTSVSITKDQTLDRDRRNRNTNFGFHYKLPGGVKIGSTLGVIRDQTVDAGRTSSSQDSERFNVNGEYEQDLATDFTGIFKVSAGTSRDHRDDPLTSSRESTGPQAEASADLKLTSIGNWSLRTLLRNSHLNSTEDRTRQTTRDNNLTGEAGMTWEFKVPGFDNWTLSAGRRHNRLQYPILINETTARQETNTNRAGDLSISASTSPWPRLTLSGSTSYRKNDVDRDIDLGRSQEAIDRAADWKLDYQFPDSTKVALRQQWSVARSLYEDSERALLNGDIRVRSLGGNANRPLGNRAGIDLAGNYNIQSFLFDDPTATPEDRDVVHGDFSGNLEYDPIEKIRTNVRVSFQHNQTIFIDATRSGTNQTQQVYSITPTFEYVLNSRITFREEGTVIANATVFDFNEDKNRLSRSTELRSTIESQPFSKLKINLRHALRFLQDGSYRRGQDGIRRFGKSREDTSRDLTFRVDYTPVTNINAHFRANQRLTDTSTRLAGQPNDLVSTNEFTEIEAGSQVSRTLKMGLKVSVDLQRLESWTSSNVGNDYWLGSIGISRQF